MIEPFCSEYTKSYRLYQKDRQYPPAKPCVYYNEPPENFHPASDAKPVYDKEKQEAVIKTMYLKRMVSIYQQDYCSKGKKTGSMFDPNNLEEDQFMVHFNHYYAKNTDPVPRPLMTARRVNGYSRHSDYHTGISVYEDTISREGYNYFKRDYDRGISRLFGQKQRELLKQKEEEAQEEKKEAMEAAESCAKVEEKPQSEVLCQKVRICGLCCEKFGDFCSLPVGRTCYLRN